MSILTALVVILPALILVVILGFVFFTARTARKVEAALPPRGKFMQVDSERIHYVDRGGSGPAIVMIHGLGGNLCRNEAEARGPPRRRLLAAGSWRG